MSEVGVTVKFAAGEFDFLKSELDRHRKCLSAESDRENELGRTAVATGLQRRAEMVQELLNDLSR